MRDTKKAVKIWSRLFFTLLTCKVKCTGEAEER